MQGNVGSAPGMPVIGAAPTAAPQQALAGDSGQEDALPAVAHQGPQTAMPGEAEGLAERAAAAVEEVWAFGERLVEVLSDAALKTPGEVQQQVAVLIQDAEPAVARSRSAWARLQAISAAAATPHQVQDEKLRGAREAMQASLAIDEVLRAAEALAAADGQTAPAALPTQPSVPRNAQAQLLQEVAVRATAITGCATSLVAPATKAAAADGAGAAGGSHAVVPPEQALQVHMEVGSAVVACVALVGAGQPGAARVALFAAEEGSAAIDAWGTSPHIVFQRISAWATQAMASFQQRRNVQAAAAAVLQGLSEDDSAALAAAAAAAPLEDLLLWLVSYDDLFSRPCTATGALLAADAASGHFFPPLLRPYGPALQRPALIAGAQGGPRAAYHPHAAPADMHRL